MPYILHTDEDRKAMLEVVGAKSVDELFEAIPEKLRREQPLDLPPALSEPELTALVGRLAARNTPAGESVSFLGAGSYDHFVPAVVDYLASRGEFATSYTPYQPEVSQGNLQVFFEYQSLVTQLTGMDVSNASLYDGATAATEAVLLALAADSKRRTVVTSAAVHPEYRQVLGTYLENRDVNLITLPPGDGGFDLAQLAEAVDEQTACILIQQPNFFGCLEDVAAVAEIAHEAGALLVEVVDPISLGLLRRPADDGADIVVAEGQSLGNPLSFGGPYVGMMACRDKFLRRLPGRVTGQTLDHEGRRCWVLTLQTREQHIRREKATSNICTNQGLLALRATIYLAAMGPQGMRELAEVCLRKAHYAAEQITAAERWGSVFDRPFFKEFVVRDRDGRVADSLQSAGEQGIFAGVPLGRWYPEYEDCLLIAVTEKRTREEIDRLASVLTTTNSKPAMAHA